MTDIDELRRLREQVRVLRKRVKGQHRLLNDVFANPDYLVDPYYKAEGEKLEKRRATLVATEEKDNG